MGAGEARGGVQTDQVVGVHVAVHAYIGAPRGQVAHHPARPRPEVLEGVLCIDATLNGVTLQGFIRGELPVLCGVPMVRVPTAALSTLCLMKCTRASTLQHTVQQWCCYQLIACAEQFDTYWKRVPCKLATPACRTSW